MTIPFYLFKRMIMPGGTRLRRLTPVPSIAGLCPTCKKPVFYKKLMGVEQLDGIYSNGIVYHYTCRPSYSSNYSSDLKKVPKGNLTEEEYRYWIGYENPSSSFAMCRACRSCVYNPKARQEHLKDESFAVGGNRCAVRLVNAYRDLEHLTTCLVCKKQRWNHMKWGVPICDSAQCLKEWKFGVGKWIALEVRLKTQKDQAAVGKTREYCHVCCLFMDNVAHEEIHSARIRSGQIYEA